jgi:hypothetical protein
MIRHNKLEYLLVSVAMSVVVFSAPVAVGQEASGVLVDAVFVNWGYPNPASEPVPRGTCIALNEGTRSIHVSALVIRADRVPLVQLTIGNSDPPQILGEPLSTAAPFEQDIDVSNGTWPVCWDLAGTTNVGEGRGALEHEFDVHLVVTAST